MKFPDKTLIQYFSLMIKFCFIIISCIFFTLPTFAESNLLIDFLNLKNIPPLITNGALFRSYDVIKLEDTWNIINDKHLILSPVKIGIVDSGVDVINPEFGGVDVINPEFGGVDFGNTPGDAKIDINNSGGHGTQVAGIIGANNSSLLGSYEYPQMNGELGGVTGLSYVLEMRRLNSSFLNIPAIQLAWSAASNINELAKKNVDVINLSFGTSLLDVGRTMFSPAIIKHPNILFVVSAGNSGINANFQFPASLGDDYDNVITVGATTNGAISGVDKRWGAGEGGEASNYGSAVNISAPGEFVYTPSPVGKGDFPTTGIGSKNYDTTFNGTSASAPLVTGVAGILKSLKSSLTPSQIKAILIRTADPITTDQPIGGRLNAYRAVCDPEVGLNCEPTLATGILEGHTTQAICDSTEVIIVPNSFVQVFTYDATLDEFNIFVTLRSDNDGFYRSPPFPVGTYYINNTPFMIRVGETTTVDSVMPTLCG